MAAPAKRTSSSPTDTECSAKKPKTTAQNSRTQLTYTDSHGNAEIIRLMLAACGEKWEDKVALDPAGAKYLSQKEHFDRMAAGGVLAFDQFPLLQIDGLNLVQKHAAVRYLARKHGFYGNNNEEATQIDIIFDSLVDFGSNGEARQTKSQAKYLPRIERALRSGSDGFLVGGALSMADVQLFYVLDYVAGGDSVANPFWGDGLLAAGKPEFMSGYPLVAAHYKMMKTNPQIAAYLCSSQRLPRNGPAGWVDRVKATIPHLFAGELYPMTSEIWNFRNSTAASEVKVYRLARASEIKIAAAAGYYVGSQLDASSGFLHLSTAAQVKRTAECYMAGATDLVLLTFDEGKLKAAEGCELRYEDAAPPDGAEKRSGDFPHLYSSRGAPWSALLREPVPLALGTDGKHIFPESVV